MTPNGDGQGDTTEVAYKLTVAANVTVTVVDPGGATIATPVDRVWTRAGAHTVTVDGASLPDGIYSVVVTARSAAGVEVQKSVPLTVSRTLGLVALEPALFSPNGDGRNDTLGVSFSLGAASTVSIKVVREGRWVATPLTASYEAGAHRFEWNGLRSVGRIKDGEYTLVLEASDPVVGPVSASVAFTADSTAPRVRFLPARGIRARGQRAGAAPAADRRGEARARGEEGGRRARALGRGGGARAGRRGGCGREPQQGGDSRPACGHCRILRVDSLS